MHALELSLCCPHAHLAVLLCSRSSCGCALHSALSHKVASSQRSPFCCAAAIVAASTTVASRSGSLLISSRTNHCIEWSSSERACSAAFSEHTTAGTCSVQNFHVSTTLFACARPYCASESATRCTAASSFAVALVSLSAACLPLPLRRPSTTGTRAKPSNREPPRGMHAADALRCSFFAASASPCRRSSSARARASRSCDARSSRPSLDTSTSERRSSDSSSPRRAESARPTTCSSSAASSMCGAESARGEPSTTHSPPPASLSPAA
mmetsp:Transcript_33019/g.77186  ORF Transcript_33019/g.77186 Transcript_33019/m.77186 type:complete len:268 (+) Transcript_33019:410-1213(+)